MKENGVQFLVGVMLSQKIRDRIAYAFDSAPSVQTPANISSKQLKDLESHDLLFHGGRYSGGRCAYREQLSSGEEPNPHADELDFLEDAANSVNDLIVAVNEHIARPEHGIDLFLVDRVRYYRPTVRSIAVRGDRLATRISLKIDEIIPIADRISKGENVSNIKNISSVQFDARLWENPTEVRRPENPRAVESRWVANTKPVREGRGLQDLERDLIRIEQDIAIFKSTAQPMLAEVLSRMAEANRQELNDVQSRIVSGDNKKFQSNLLK